MKDFRRIAASALIAVVAVNGAHVRARAGSGAGRGAPASDRAGVWGGAPFNEDTPKATRINRAIDLLSQGQPIYYTGSHEGTDGSFEQGVKDAQTYADYISYDMEHAPYDIKGLAEYMQGLAAGTPTRSGHRTPAVIVNVPVNGTDEAAVHANAWMFAQVLATGRAVTDFCGVQSE